MVTILALLSEIRGEARVVGARKKFLKRSKARSARACQKADVSTREVSFVEYPRIA